MAKPIVLLKAGILITGGSSTKPFFVSRVSNSSSSSALSEPRLERPKPLIKVTPPFAPLTGLKDGGALRAFAHSSSFATRSESNSILNKSMIYRRTGSLYRWVEIVCRALKNILGDEKTSRYSARDLNLFFLLGDSYGITVRQTYFAKDRDAALAMTVFPRFWIAVITSISVCSVGGIRCVSLPSETGAGSQGGICYSVSELYWWWRQCRSQIWISLGLLVYIVQ